MRFSGDTGCSKSSESTNRGGQEQNGKRLDKAAAFLLLTVLAFVPGCSGKKNQKSLIDVLNKSMGHDRVMLYLPLGREGQACSDLKLEPKPVPDQVVYAAAQKAGLITIKPDGPDFWKIESVEISPAMAEVLKRAAHNTKDGCDSIGISSTIAYKAASEIQNIRKVDDDQSEVEFTWKWTLTPYGAKFVNKLSQQELVALNGHLNNPSLNEQSGPTFNIADMAHTGAVQTAKKILSKYEMNR